MVAVATKKYPLLVLVPVLRLANRLHLLAATAPILTITAILHHRRSARLHLLAVAVPTLAITAILRHRQSARLHLLAAAVPVATYPFGVHGR